jgi:hypothetical protein
MLLEGLGTVSDMQDILADIPPRHVTDILITRYFNSTEYSIGMTQFSNTSYAADLVQ